MAKKFKIEDYTQDNQIGDDLMSEESLLRKSFLDRQVFGVGGLIAKQSLLNKGFWKKIGWSEIDDDNNLRPVKLYDAIVSQDGSGHYIQISDALADGHKRIYVRTGHYYVNADITLDSDVTIIGEDRDNTIIDFNSTGSQVTVRGTGFYNTGTITVTNGSAVITGAGTVWSTNLSAGDYIIFNGQVCTIASVDSNTQVTIDRAYVGDTAGLVNYVAGAYKTNIQIQNMTFTGQTPAASDAVLEFWYTANVYLNNLKIIDNKGTFGSGSYGIQLFRSSNCIFSNIIAEDNEEGIELFYADYIQLNNITTNNNYYGVLLSNGNYCQLTNVTANNNGSLGLYLLSNSNCVFSNITTNYNHSAGVYITGTYNKIINLDSNYNGQRGVFLLSTYSTISSSHIANNGENGIDCSAADYTVIEANVIENNEYHGINLDNTDRAIISNNLLKDNSQATNNTYSEIILGLTGDSDYNIVNGNNIYCQAANKSKYGIREENAGCDYNIITSNIMDGAVTDELSLQGVNTLHAHNIPDSSNYGAGLVVTKTSDYTIVLSNLTIIADGTSNTVSITLPTAAGITGKVFNIKCIDDTFAVDVDCTGAETIDGETSQDLHQWDNIQVQSDGTNWIII